MISVINFDTKPQTPRKVEMFPNVIRCGIFGPSGVGKSNVLLTILLHIRPFFNIYLCSRTADQDKYKLLGELIDSYNKKNRKKIKFHLLSIDNLPEPEKVEREAIIIFDDILTENQDKIANFFLRGRHHNISCFYLSQMFTRIPKKCAIRNNLNYLIMFRVDLINLRQIHVEFITDLSFEKFKQMCNECWREPYGFLVVDVDNEWCKYKKKFECKLV